MRHFHSYGPIDSEEHFHVARRELIDQYTAQMTGKPGKSGHYFTLWAPRQTGKTWLMQQTVKAIQSGYGDTFRIGTLSMQGIILKDEDPEEKFLSKVPRLFFEGFDMDIAAPQNWEDFTGLFLKDRGIFDRPLLLFIDEFDSLPAKVTDCLVTLFRDMYLKKEKYILHGLALIGVRAVLGVDSHQGSPFNIQRALHVPNLTHDEVEEMFGQYSQESGQDVDPDVIHAICEVTKGQPGLVSWFGELLTETYNPDKNRPIDTDVWKSVYNRACHSEWNNTVLNIIKKARTTYSRHVLELFHRPDVKFSIDAEWCGYMYMHGLIDKTEAKDEKGECLCRFSSPFIQLKIYNALTYDLVDDRMPILALDPLDELTDVFEEPLLNIPALLQRYKDYLARLKARGLNPWKEQPRRKDMHLTEAVGHFHLYAWLQSAIGRRCVISPEFPTGNGKVDLRLKCFDKQGLIEVKSFVNSYETKMARKQAASYAKSSGLDSVTVAIFIPVEDETVLEKLSDEQVIEGVRVTVVAIGWV